MLTYNAASVRPIIAHSSSRRALVRRQWSATSSASLPLALKMLQLLKLMGVKTCALSSSKPKSQALLGVGSPIRTLETYGYTSHFREHFNISYVDVEVSVTPSLLSKPYDPALHWTRNFDQEMAEPRARAARHKGQLNFGPESKRKPQKNLPHLDLSPFPQIAITDITWTNVFQLFHSSMHLAMSPIPSAKPCASSMRS